MNHDMLKPDLPWWRVPTAWLMLGGPVLVVLASLVTLVIAVRGGDTPLRETHATVSTTSGALAPATQARNHAVAAHR